MQSESRATPSAVGDDVRSLVANLDTTYQKAVKEGDVAMMDCILADDMVLVTGKGRIFTKEDLLEEARSGRLRYEHQEELEQSVRVWGQTAVVTALLWANGTDDGKPFDYKLWFSDTYVVLRQAGGTRSGSRRSRFPRRAEPNHPIREVRCCIQTRPANLIWAQPQARRSYPPETSGSPQKGTHDYSSVILRPRYYSASPSSVRAMTAIPWSIIEPTVGAASCGRRSAVHTTRLPCSWGKTWTDAL
jgi:ketosteroid isomerase-like protein